MGVPAVEVQSLQAYDIINNRILEIAHGIDG